MLEDDHILLLDQDTEGDRSWSLPGGKVEPGETIEEALWSARCGRETGLDIRVGNPLYGCDVVKAHLVHLSFECRRVGGTLEAVKPGADTRSIRAVELVKLADLLSLGFNERFLELARAGWPDAGSCGHQEQHRPVAPNSPFRYLSKRTLVTD